LNMSTQDFKSKKPDPNIKDKYHGWTPLIFAIN
jgi:ankyrin repeat protein